MTILPNLLTRIGLLFYLLFFCYFSVSAQQGIGIGTEIVNNDAVLEIESVTKGLLIPRMTTTQRLATGASSEGLLVYDTNDEVFYYYDGGQWRSLIDSELFTATVNNLNSQISTLQSRATNLENRATSLEARATNLESDVATLESRLNELIDEIAISPTSGERSIPSNVTSGTGFNVSIPFIGSTTYNVDVTVVGTVRWKTQECIGSDCVWVWSAPDPISYVGATTVTNKQNKSFRVVFTQSFVNNETGPEIAHIQYNLQKFTYTATR